MGTEAAALAAVMARVQVVAAYPITPQTVTVEELSNYIGQGDLAAEFLSMESEHSAMAACVGASATGSRAFTATSSQGLALMHEMLHHAAGWPFADCHAERQQGVCLPLGISIATTPTPCLSGTQVGSSTIAAMFKTLLDGPLIAYKVAEKIMLPVMINLDAFYLTHTSEIVDIPEQAEVDAFLPSYLPRSQGGR